MFKKIRGVRNLAAYTECAFCGNKITYIQRISGRDAYNCTCHNCGNYTITDKAIMYLQRSFQLDYQKKSYLFCAYLRDKTEKNIPLEMITTDNINDLVNRAALEMPKTINQIFDRFLLYLHEKTTYLFEEIPIDLSQPAVACAKSTEEFENILEGLKELEYIIPPRILDTPRKYVLSLKGIDRVEFLLRNNFTSNKGFVAMMFSPEMFDVYDKYISQAIIDAGYEAMNVAANQYNDDICDEIIAQIRESRFVVADLTGHKGGVYYEAGFAYGLGLPVIWTCKNDSFKDSHFDVNHNNFIIWNDGEELYKKLVNRIKATIPKD